MARFKEGLLKFSPHCCALYFLFDILCSMAAAVPALTVMSSSMLRRRSLMLASRARKPLATHVMHICMWRQKLRDGCNSPFFVCWGSHPVTSFHFVCKNSASKNGPTSWSSFVHRHCSISISTNWYVYAGSIHLRTFGCSYTHEIPRISSIYCVLNWIRLDGCRVFL